MPSEIVSVGRLNIFRPDFVCCAFFWHTRTNIAAGKLAVFNSEFVYHFVLACNRKLSQHWLRDSWSKSCGMSTCRNGFAVSNQWQTGALLSSGKNRVEFGYHPTLFRMLMILNQITILLVLRFLLFRLYRNRLLRPAGPMPS